MIIKKNAYDNISCHVTGAYWERIRLWLTVRIECKDPERGANADALQFYIANISTGKCAGVFESSEQKGNEVKLCFLATDNGDNSCLDTGEYMIAAYVNDGKDPFYIPLLNGIDAGRQKDLIKTFPFQKVKWYRVECSCVPPAGDGDGSIFCLRISRYDGKNTLRRRLSGVKKLIIQSTYNAVKTLSPKRKERVLFLADLEEKPGQNLIAVQNKMAAAGFSDKDISFGAVYPAGRKKCLTDDLKLACSLASNRTVVIDEHIPMLDWLDPGKDMVLIQLWHAGVGFKATGYSRWGHKGAVAPMSSHRRITYATVSSRAVTGIFSELWGIAGEQIIPCGIPKMDMLLDEEKVRIERQYLLDRFPILKNKKVILFAPTYRGRGKKDAAYPEDKLDIPALAGYARENGRAVLIKMHPWVRKKISIDPQYANVIADASDIPVERLYAVTDLLITDYSSALFEFSYLKKPMLFYAFDEEQYGKDRGFHRPYRENAPGKVVTTFEELLEALKNEDYEEYKVEEYVRKHFDNVDSHSAERVIEWLIKGNMPGKYRKALKDHEAYVKSWKELQFAVPD